MEEVAAGKTLESAARLSEMHRNTASRYVSAGKLPSELRGVRDWRTRTDPFASTWPRIQSMMEDAPELEAKSVFEHLLAEDPDRYDPGQLRTLQRRLRRWRAQAGPPKEVFFAQEHRPGEAMQTDFTWATLLEVTIGGEAFPHMLCHPVLPYSNWEWVTVCRSESLASLRRGVQCALFQLGRIPKFHQTDNSTAATHDLRTGKRGFNADYEVLMAHFGLTPRTIAVGKSEQNGDVEALNGALKRRLLQHLLLRGSRDFGSIAEYELWLHEKVSSANRLRHKRVSEELDAMRELQVRRLPEYTEQTASVTRWSTINVAHNIYSVPSRLQGEDVRVQVYDDRLEVWYAGAHQLTVERLLGRNGRRINYRHIIWSLVQKPGAFERYCYREEMFPTPTFRRAYDALCGRMERRKADVEYLRILHLAASTMESEVETALELLLGADAAPSSRAVKDLAEPGRRLVVPDLAPSEVDLAVYDCLLPCSVEVAS